MKKYTAKPGQKVTIEINRKKVQSPAPSVPSPKGLLTASREDDYQARRLSGNVTFYDLGQILTDGSFIDRYLEADLTSDLSVLEAFVNAPLASDFSLWSDLFYKIPSADLLKYQIAVSRNTETIQKLVANPKLTEAVSRFRLETYTSGDANIFYESGGLFAVFDTDLSKITAVPDFTAPAVTFALSKTAAVKVFLNPAIFSVNGSFQNSYSQTSASGGSTTLDIAVYKWDLHGYPLAASSPPDDAVIEYLTIFTTNSDDDSFQSKIINWKRSDTVPNYIEDISIAAGWARAAARLIADYPGTVAQKRTLVDRIINRYTVGHTLPNGALFFPYFRAVTSGTTWHGFAEPFDMTPMIVQSGTDVTSPLESWTHALNFQPRDTPEGLLKAVFSQGTNLFYVWSVVGES